MKLIWITYTSQAGVWNLRWRPQNRNTRISDDRNDQARVIGEGTQLMLQRTRSFSYSYFYPVHDNLLIYCFKWIDNNLSSVYLGARARQSEAIKPGRSTAQRFVHWTHNWAYRQAKLWKLACNNIDFTSVGLNTLTCHTYPISVYDHMIIIWVDPHGCTHSEESRLFSLSLSLTLSAWWKLHWVDIYRSVDSLK